MARRRLVVLLAILASVLGWAWVTDRPGPAEPRGSFVPVVVQTAVLVTLVALAALGWRAARGSGSAEPGAAPDRRGM